MRPDVALISPYPPPGERHGGHSGVASYTANLAHALGDAGARVAVVAPRDRAAPPVHEDGSVTVLRAFGSGPSALPRAARAAAATGAPVVHLQHEMFLYGGPAAVPGLGPALAGLRARRRRTVTTLHQVVGPGDVDRDFTTLHRVRVPASLARAGLTTVQRGAARLSDRCVVHEAPFAAHVPGAIVVPHGVQDVATPARDVARAALGEPQDGLLVLCFGFLAPYKGLEQAITAVARAGDAVRLVIAGGEHPRLRGYGAELARAAGPRTRLVGRVPDAEVATWFAAADVALLLYPRPFSSSGVLALALAHGTPLLLSDALATSVGAPPAMRVGRDPAASLRALAADPAQRGALAAANGELARERSWAHVAARHHDIYEEVRGAGRDRQQ
jgi:glycosyltransferase involved in cell wall biosynthesis